jgi:hypothetical protein
VSISITLADDFLVSMGSRMMTRGTGNLGTYATNGVAIAASDVGLGRVDDIMIDPAGGYVFEYVKSTGKVKAYQSAGAGVTAVNVKGSQVAGPALQVLPDSNAGVLGKTTAGDLVIPAATFGLTVTAAAGLAEVGVVSLAATTFNWRAIGE